MSKDTSPALFFVTGLSGAGLSSSLKILEDLGCEVFDNVPLSLVPALIESQSAIRPMAFGMDTRTRSFEPTAILKYLETLKSRRRVISMFLSADEAVLLKRFTETRRTHPLAKDRAVADGIAAEKSLLYPLKYESDIVIDTSDLSIHDLRRQIEGHISGIRNHKLNISIMSFAFRHGLPREADLVFDVRFLRNPNWVPELKPLTGREKDVQIYIEGDDTFAAFDAHIRSLLELLIPKYNHEGKNYLTIAFGCTGGKHRSVFLAERTAAWLRDKGETATIHHREQKF